MKQLASSFRKDDFDFTLIKRQGNAAMFSKTKPPADKEYGGPGYHGYEVVIIQQYQAGTIAGNPVEAREAMPSSESWGTSGWTCQTKERAELRFQAVLTQDSNAIPYTESRGL